MTDSLLPSPDWRTEDLAQGSRILVLDHQLHRRRRIVAVLQGVGYRVREYAGGVDGLAALPLECPDLVIVQQALPDLPGAEVCRHIKETGSARRTLVVCLSEGPGAFEGGLAAGSLKADGCLRWPMSAGDLVTQVNALLKLQRAERSLDLYQALIQAAFDGFCLIDRDGRLLEVNDAYCRMTGYSRAELLGMRVHDLEASECRAETDARLRRIAERAGERFEARHSRRDGSVLEVEVNVRALPEADGRMVASVRDLSGERSSDRQVELLLAALEAAANAIVLTDREGRIEWVNAAFCRLTGYAPGEVLGQNPRLLKSGQHPAAFYRDLWETVLAGRVWQGELVNRRKDGTDYHERMTITPVAPSGGPITHLVAVKEDVTERVRAEQRLRQSETSLAAAQRMAGLGDWESDLASGEIRWSDEVYRLFGLDPGATRPTRELFLRLVHPDDAARVRESVARATREGTPYQLDHRIVRADGIERVVHEQGEVVRDGAGRPVRLRGTVQDITERKRAEEALARERDLLHALMDNVPDPIFFKDPETRVIRGNRAHAEALGFARPDEVVGKTDAELLPPDRAQEYHEEELMVLRSRQPVIGRVRGDRASREGARWWSETRVPILDAKGEVTGLVGISRDITELKTAKETVNDLFEILDQAREAIVITDLAGGIHYLNRGAERLFGWSLEQASGRPLNELMYGDWAEFDSSFRRVRSAGEWQGEVWARTRDGRRCQVDARWTLGTDRLGKPRSILALNTDITEKKRLEGQFLRAQRLESIGALASGVAHDLNNTLAPILMALPLLRPRLADPEDQSLVDLLDASTRRSSAIIRQLLTFGRGAEGERARLDPRTLVLEMARIIQETFPKTLTLQVDAAPDLPGVLGDATQLHQVLLNLCVNARDAMPGGGVLRLAARESLESDPTARPGDAPRRRDYVVFEVSDTGVGIPEEIRERIFDPFFTTKEPGRGTGLGLSTAQGIVKDHGGHIQVDTEVGRGTRFRVCLPAAGRADADRAADAERAPSGQGELVLVVDDEVSVRRVTQQMLQMHRYRVLTAGDGLEALALLQGAGSEARAVVMDMMMPGLDGPSTLRQMRALRPDLPVIAVSGLPAEEERAQAASGASVQFLCKPFTVSQLLAALRSALQAPQAE